MRLLVQTLCIAIQIDLLMASQLQNIQIIALHLPCQIPHRRAGNLIPNKTNEGFRFQNLLTQSYRPPAGLLAAPVQSSTWQYLEGLWHTT